MALQIDISVLEILASKICHDLISPIGAISNGVEFLADMGADAGDEITDLIQYSSLQASAKLQCYRLAYGAGGSDTSIKPEDVHKTFNLLIQQDGKIKQEWDPHAPIGPDERPAGFGKMIMCALILGTECLPRGGVLSVKNDGAEGVFISAEGENAGLFARAGDALTLKLSSDAIDPRLVHPYMCGLLAKYHGFSFTISEEKQGSVRFNIKKA